MAQQDILQEEESILDTFNDLIDSPEAFEEVSNLLLAFVNAQFKEFEIQLPNLKQVGTDHLILLMGLLGDYFVPLSKWISRPTSKDDKLMNMNTLLQLMQEADIETEFIKVQGDLVSTRCHWWRYQGLVESLVFDSTAVSARELIVLRLCFGFFSLVSPRFILP